MLLHTSNKRECGGRLKASFRNVAAGTPWIIYGNSQKEKLIGVYHAVLTVGRSFISPALFLSLGAY